MKNLEELRNAVTNKSAQILTLDLANKLKGKHISTIYFGYRGQDGFDNFIVGEIRSSYDLAKDDTNYKSIDPKFNNRAEYWECYMTKEKLNDEKSTMVLLASDGRDTFIRAHSINDGVFSCSDTDRFVYFVEDEN